MPPKGRRKTKKSKKHEEDSDGEKSKKEEDTDLEPGDKADPENEKAEDEEAKPGKTAAGRKANTKRQFGGLLGSILRPKKAGKDAFSSTKEIIDEHLSWSWWSCRGCCRLCRYHCRRRCRMCCGSVCKAISEALKGIGLQKTTTYKRFARLINRKNIDKPKTTDKLKTTDKPETNMVQKMKAEVGKMFGDLRQTKRTKRKMRMPTHYGNRVIQRPESTDGFSLASFVIHNDGIIADFFELDETEQGGQEIAAGGCSHIFKAAERQTHIVRAIKRITKKNVLDEEFLKNEVNIMKRLDHPNIPKLFEIFENDRYVYLVMEICEGGDLMDKILAVTAMTEPTAGVVLKALLMALFYLHANEVVHRDIKPENVMFRDADTEISLGQIRIVDFGFAKNHPLESEDPMETKVGSPFYVAPEVLNGEGYDMMADVWSVGVVAYLILCGYPPFAGPTDAETLELVKKGEYIFPKEKWKNITKEAKHLVAHLMRKNPQKRMSLKRALEHPWIRTKGLTKWEHMREETVDRLITYHKHHALRKAAMLAIAYQMEPPDIIKLRDLYHSLDANGDGLLQRAEFMKGVQACGVDEHFIQEMIRSVDADSSGLIDYTEFIAATLEKDTYIKNHAVCLRAFRSFDHDDSGQLSLEEVAEILDMGSTEHEEEVAYFFNEVDDDKNGFMDYREFHCMLQVEIDGLRAKADGQEEFVVDEEQAHGEGEESEEEDDWLDEEEDFEFDTHVEGHENADDNTMAVDDKTLAERELWKADKKAATEREAGHQVEAFTTGKHGTHLHHSLDLAEAEVVANKRAEKEEEEETQKAAS